jgi:HTH-type transcriptional regulator/antitoxin HipB
MYSIAFRSKSNRLHALADVCYCFHPRMNALANMLTIRTPAEIGALIRDQRRSHRLDQADLARMVGVSRLWINQIEHGKPGASLGLVLRTLDALNVRLLAEVSDRAAANPAEIAPVISADIDAIVADARRTDHS